MDRFAAALVLEEIGSLLELAGENPFKAKAFQAAARALEKTGEDAERLAREGGLERLSGFGPATARVVRELLQAGRSSYYDELRQRTPSGLRELLAVPGLGARKIRQLHEALGIESLADLEAAVRAGRVAAVRGFGQRTQERIAKGLVFARGSTGRRRLAQVLESGGRVLGHVRSLPQVVAAELAGELRRRLEIVTVVDIVTAAADADCAAVLAAFRALPGTRRMELEAADEACVQLADGLLWRLACVPHAQYACRLLCATGSDAHLEALQQRAARLGLSLSATGLRRGTRLLDTPDEALIYGELELAWVPPELRENGAEVELAAAHALPELVSEADLRGSFHCHTTASDGTATVSEMAGAALARGWRYLGIADHSPAAFYAGGLSPADIERQHAEIDAWNAERGRQLWLFKGVEADILADGTIDLAESGLLPRFDYVVASVHSQFRMARAQMTARVLRALDNPHVTMLGHPTGRLLLQREGYALDLGAVIERAASRGVLLEINADPHRLDLDWRHWPAARAAGVRAAINPDAHSTHGLDVVEYGVYMARKGGLSAADVLNTHSLAAVKRHFEARHR
jgi:DNA polymerase (family 10)